MDTIAAAVTGARHLRSQRNGQDAAIAWSSPHDTFQMQLNCISSVGTEDELGVVVVGDGSGGARSEEGVVVVGDGCSGGARSEVGVVVVGDGCSGGASSEVGARLGVTLFARALSARLQSGACVTAVETWSAVRGDVVRALSQLLEAMTGVRGDDTRRCGDMTGVAIRERAIHDMFLFTIIAAAATRDGAAVWALGDGAYSFALDDGHYSLAGRSAGAIRREARVLGPFVDNAPPYLGYDLLGDAREACFEVAPSSVGAIVVATDGVLDLDLAAGSGLARFACDEYLEHPDKLRRELSLLARAEERIDWNERRVVRTPAVLQDDCAIGVLRWRQP